MTVVDCDSEGCGCVSRSVYVCVCVDVCLGARTDAYVGVYVDVCVGVCVCADVRVEKCV